MKRNLGTKLGVATAVAIGAACLISPQQAQAQFGITFGGRRGGVSVWTAPPVRHGFVPYSGYRYHGYRAAPRRGYYVDPYRRGYYVDPYRRGVYRRPSIGYHRPYYYKPRGKYRRFR